MWTKILLIALPVMHPIEQSKRVAEFGDLHGPFRNIRIQLDGTSLMLDLFPQKILDRTLQDELREWPKEVQNALRDTKPIVESNTVLRIAFENVQGLIVQEEFIDKINLVSEHDEIIDRTFATIEHSRWRASLEDFEMGDNPYLKHYRCWSYETRIDVLGVLIEGEWIKNNPD